MTEAISPQRILNEAVRLLSNFSEVLAVDDEQQDDIDNNIDDLEDLITRLNTKGITAI